MQNEQLIELLQGHKSLLDQMQQQQRQGQALQLDQRQQQQFEQMLGTQKEMQQQLEQLQEMQKEMHGPIVALKWPMQLVKEHLDSWRQCGW